VKVEVIRVEAAEEEEDEGIEESELDAPVEVCSQKEQSQVVMACNRPPEWESFS